MTRIDVEVNGQKCWYDHKEWHQSIQWHKWLEGRMFQQDKEGDKFSIWFEDYYSMNFPQKTQTP